MKKLTRSMILILLVLPVFLMAIPARVEASGKAFSNDLIQLTWFYKPPSSGDMATAAQYFDNFILTRNDEDARDDLQGLGVDTPFIQYYLSNAIHNPGPNNCTAQPWANNVADQPGDYCWIRDNHPDWFLKDSSGKAVQMNDGGQYVVFMDPRSTGWQQFFVSRLIERQQTHGWDGLFLDNVDGGLQRYRNLGVTLKDYKTDASYVTGMAAFLSAVHNGYQHPTDRPIFANITEMADNATWYTYLEYLDGAMDEGWGVDWHNGYVSTWEWQENIERAQQTQALGKRIILVSQADSRDNYDRQDFAFASYLLTANHLASFRYAGYDYYDEAWIYDNYNTQLGEPQGDAYQQDGTWRRDFDAGYVTVNPQTHSAAIVVTDTLPTPPPPTNPYIPPVDGSEQHIFLPLLSSPAW